MSIIQLFMWAICFFPCTLVFGGSEPCHSKALICGVCRNVESAVPNTIKNIEALGGHFADYRVIVYENNSEDRTVALLTNWASGNPRVTFVNEMVSDDLLGTLARTEKISRARNIVLDLVRNGDYADFDYLIMADLDFQREWPIAEILESIRSPVDWDCVSANGIFAGGWYFDRYAFRNAQFPFGPEVMGDEWWNDLNNSWFQVQGTTWPSVHSAFGGLAIYKLASLIAFSYSGTITNDLRMYYQQMLQELPHDHPSVKKYLGLLGKSPLNWLHVPIIFRVNTACEHPKNFSRITCCEHIPLHASMALHGFGKFYINPKMIMYY